MKLLNFLTSLRSKVVPKFLDLLETKDFQRQSQDSSCQKCPLKGEFTSYNVCPNLVDLKILLRVTDEECPEV